MSDVTTTMDAARRLYGRMTAWAAWAKAHPWQASAGAILAYAVMDRVGINGLDAALSAGLAILRLIVGG